MKKKVISKKTKKTTKPKAKPAAQKLEFPHYWLCAKCAKKMGGVWPKGHCCTVMQGKCPYCGVSGTIIPYVDFNWPSLKTAHLRD